MIMPLPKKKFGNVSVIYRAIFKLRPPYQVGKNVTGFLSLLYCAHTLHEIHPHKEMAEVAPKIFLSQSIVFLI